MPETYTQERRPLEVFTPLGKDVLLLRAFTGQEAMSRLFTYQLEMLSSNHAITAKDIVGKSVGWGVKRETKPLRYFNGFVNRFTAGGLSLKGLRTYRAEVVPWLWFLTRTTDCRIFQNKTAPEIIEQIFSDLGQTDYDSQVKGTYVKRDYCVQYRETDFDFVSRLMEEEGIFYFFRHDKNKHTLVLADKKFVHKDLPEKDVEFATGSLEADHVSRWEHHYAFRSGKWSQTDYNFETPSTSLMASVSTSISLTGNSKLDLYDYPGGHAKKADGDALARVRIEEEEVHHDVVEGASTCATFATGGKFTLKKHHSCPSEAGKSFVLTAVMHSARDSSYSPGADAAEEYGNTFTCIPADVPFRPARVTPRPVVKGPQTAVVVGPKGEEIYTDKYGRVKVQFFWDREGKKDENSSCWIRVAESWAGKNWGVVFNPRIGQEVVVDFLEGDPDRPLITGGVYNAEQMPPYELPKQQTQSVVKTRSSKGGSTETFNELRFEDKKDNEEIYFHAEKDFNRVVENNDTLKVGHEKKDKGDQTIDIFNNRSLKVGCKDGKDGSETTEIFNNQSLKVGCAQAKEGSQTVEIFNSQSLKVGCAQAKEGSQTVEIWKDRTVTLDTGNDTERIKQGNREVTIDIGDDTLTIKVGDQTTKVNLGKSTTQAMESIELKVGSSSIKIDSMGVTIKGMNVKIDADMIASMKGGMSAKVEAGVMLTAKGTLTKIG
jgi:type VI secretion system secreted protein VgrG